MKGSFELSKERSFKEVCLAVEEITVLDEELHETQLKVEENDVLIVFEEYTSTFDVLFFTETGPKYGLVDKTKIKKLNR